MIDLGVVADKIMACILYEACVYSVLHNKLTLSWKKKS